MDAIKMIGILLYMALGYWAAGKTIYANKIIIEYFSSEYPLEYPEPISTTVLIKKGYKVGECHVEMNAREGGKSSIRTWKTIYYMFNVILSIVVTCLRRYKN